MDNIIKKIYDNKDIILINNILYKFISSNNINMSKKDFFILFEKDIYYILHEIILSNNIIFDSDLYNYLNNIIKFKAKNNFKLYDAFENSGFNTNKLINKYSYDYDDVLNNYNDSLNNYNDDLFIFKLY